MDKISEPSAPPLYPNLEEISQVVREDKGETFRLKRISNIREFLEKEVETRGRYRRRYKSLYNTAIYVNAGAGLAAVASFVGAGTMTLTGIGIFAAVPLGFTAVAIGVLSVISAGISKILLKKVENHQQIKLIAVAKLSSVNVFVSKALQDGHVSNEEYQFILQEIENYRSHKTDIRNRTIGEVKQLTVDKENEIREESLKKRHSERSRNSYGQPQGCYERNATAIGNKRDVKLKFNLLCCSSEITTE